MSAPPPVDPKDQRAFMELQEKLIEAHQQMKNIALTNRSQDQTSQRARLTAHEIVELDDSTKMYQAVGRAYFLETKEGILKTLAETIKGAEEEMKSLAGAREHMEKTIKSTEGEMRELLESAPGLAARAAGQH